MLLFRYVSGAVRAAVLFGLGLSLGGANAWCETSRTGSQPWLLKKDGARAPSSALRNGAFYPGRLSQAEQMLSMTRAPASQENQRALIPRVRVTGTCRDSLRSYETCISGRSYRSSSQAGAALLLPLGR